MVNTGNHRGVFVDRDGVINRAIVKQGKPFAPTTISEFEIIEGVGEAIGILKKHNFKIAIITNQPDVAFGRITMNTLNQFNSFLNIKLGIEHIYTCIHSELDSCECRKPKPGLILQAAQELGVNLKKSFLVGDRWRDIEAAHALSIKSFFIDYSYLEKKPTQPFVRVKSLFEAAQLIIKEY